MSAKKTQTLNLRGEFDFNSMKLSYTDKEKGERTINLKDVLGQFHNCEISLSIKESSDIPAEEDDELEDTW